MAANTATADLSNLTGGTAYTYKAYSNSNCTTELTTNTTDAEFSTVGLTAASLTRTGATLNLANWTAAWWHTKTAGPGSATCVSVPQGTASSVLSGLTADSAYTWAVYSAANCSAATRIADVAFTISAPTLVSSSVEASTATLTIGKWTSAWHYKADAAPDNTCKGPVSAGTLTKNLTGLSGNTSYIYEAYSDATCTTANLLVTAAAFLTKPGTPTTPVAIRTGSGALTLSASVTGGGTLTGWQYQQKEGSGDYGSWTSIASTSTSLSHAVTGLTNAVSYQFKVRAKNATGDSAASTASTAITPTAMSLTASSVEAVTATLTVANHSGAWYYKANAGPDNTCKGPVSGLTQNLTGLSTNTSYTYEAYSDASCTTANLLTTTPAFLTKPGKPTTPTVAAGTGSGKLTLSASVTGSGSISKWQYQQKASSDTQFGSWNDISSTSTMLSYTVTGLTDATSYQFKVRAKKATCEGAASDASTATAPADETLAAISISATGATLTIGNYSGDWYHKEFSPGTGTCTLVVGSTTAELSNLTASTSYT